MPESGSSRSGFMPARVIQLHPSRFCNLACQHCYSASGPDVRGELAPEVVLSALAVLRAEGYEVLSFSGGEPLLYSGLETVARGAADLGFRINLITNGAPVSGRLLEVITRYVNLVAVSLDGAPAMHVELRSNSQAFVHAERAMDRLANAGMEYGLAYCVSKESLSDMPWAVEFGKAKGAALVQFHPFAATGRGRRLADRLLLDELDKARAYIVAALLGTGEGPAIQLDLAPIEVAQLRRDDYRVLVVEEASTMLLSDLANPLIIDETGAMFPFSYGIHERFALGRLGPDFDLFLTEFKRNGWRELRSLLETAFALLGARGETFVDWFYHLVETSRILPSAPYQQH